jgi:pimeloyl-ACP methyl ester carboxylesterase
MPAREPAWHDRAMARSRTVNPVLPAEVAVHDGLAYSLWLASGGPGLRGGVVILHGAGSCKESHHDFARVLVAAGFAALAFDQRGHGASDGPMDGRAIEDVVAMAELLRSRIGDDGAPVALRGSSMGGCFSLLAAGPAGAQAVVAICPASTGGLRRGVLAGTLGFDACTEALGELLGAMQVDDAVASLDVPVLLLHAEGDETVPVAHSRELAAGFVNPDSRLIAVPGGHHRSVQHDEELQAVSVRFLERALG